MKTEYLPDLVANEFAQAAKYKKEDVKYVIDFVSIYPALILQMALVMMENEELLGTISQYYKRPVEETVDNYIAQLAYKTVRP